MSKRALRHELVLHTAHQRASTRAIAKGDCGDRIHVPIYLQKTKCFASNCNCFDTETGFTNWSICAHTMLEPLHCVYRIECTIIIICSLIPHCVPSLNSCTKHEIRYARLHCIQQHTSSAFRQHLTGRTKHGRGYCVVCSALVVNHIIYYRQSELWFPALWLDTLSFVVL